MNQIPHKYLGQQAALQPPENLRITGPSLSKKENEAYSIMRAIEAASTGDWRGAGFERELSKHLLDLQNDPDASAPHRLVVPGSVLHVRDMTAGSSSAGGYLVATEIAGLFDALRPRSLALQMGTQTLDGLQSHLTFTGAAAGATAGWLANEASTITESTPTLGQVSLSPKTVGGYIEVSRRLMIQSGPLGELFIRRDLAAALASALDAGVFAGSGASGQPTGIINTAGVGIVSGASFDYADGVAMQTGISTSNGFQGGPIGYACRPAVAELLATRQGFSTLAPLWSGPIHDGVIAGARAMTSMNLPAATLVAVDFSQLLIAQWGVGFELQINPFANFQSAIFGVRALLTVDSALLQPACACVATSVS